MRKALVFLLLAGLLLFGCIEERSISTTGDEKISVVSGSDLDLNGANEILVYQYTQIPIDSELGISMRKVVIVSPDSYAYTVNAYKDVDAAALVDIKSKLEQFKSEKEQQLALCTGRLGLAEHMCDSTDACLGACTSAQCENAKKYGERPLGNYLLEMVGGSGEIDATVDEMLAYPSLATPTQKEQFVQKGVMLIELSDGLAANPIFETSSYALCSKPGLRVDLLQSAVAQVAEVDAEPSYYKYQAMEVATGGSEEDYIELFIRESPPLLIEIESASVNVLGDGVNAVYQKEPLSIGWENVKLQAARVIVAYQFLSPDAPDEEVMEKWSVPQVLERNLKLLSAFSAILQNPLFVSLINTSAGVFRFFYSLGVGYYAALGAAFTLWVWGIAFLILILAAIYATFKAYVDKKNVHEELVEKMGPPLADWRTYFGLGVGLVAVSIAMSMFYVKPTEVGELDIPSMMVKVSTDLVGAIAALVFVMGGYVLYLLVEDWLKGLALGEEYYAVRGATREENVKALRELKKKLAQLKEQVETLSKMGMVVQNEYAVVVSVPVERFEQMIESGKQNMAKQLMSFHMGMLLDLEKKLENKTKVMDEKWPEWREAIESALKQADEVPLNTLMAIPLQWREWAARKYISERRRALVIEGGAIKRRKIAVEEVISRLISELERKKLMKKGVLMHNDKPVYNSFSKGNRTVGAALFLKLMEYSKSLSKKFGGAELHRFVMSGDKDAFVYLTNNEYRALLFADKENIRELVETWNSRLGESA